MSALQCNHCDNSPTAMRVAVTLRCIAMAIQHSTVRMLSVCISMFPYRCRLTLMGNTVSLADTCVFKQLLGFAWLLNNVIIDHHGIGLSKACLVPGEISRYNGDDMLAWSANVCLNGSIHRVRLFWFYAPAHVQTSLVYWLISR